MNAPYETPFKRRVNSRTRSRTQRRVQPPHRRKILFEQLEQRLLLSADGASPGIADELAAALLDSPAQQPATQTLQADGSLQSTQSTIPPDAWIDL
ncbi:MAG: LEPR-XLL domain-containing protein, partial [bacterium]